MRAVPAVFLASWLASPALASVDIAVRKARPAPATTEPDRDRDRIPDVRDQCPDQPEAYNGVDDEDGCPDKGAVRTIIHRFRIDEKIPFAAGKATLDPEALPLVDRVAAILAGNPQIRLIEVQGHAAAGEPNRLALARALAVITALGARGVKPERLSSRGYGRGRPACTTLDEACRTQNRRVEFRFLPPPR